MRGWIEGQKRSDGGKDPTQVWYSILIDPAAIDLNSEKVDNTISNIKATYAQRLMDIVFYVYVYIRSELVGFNLFAA